MDHHKPTKMATYYESTTTFDFNWRQVAQAFWNRYPNPLSNHVLTEDTIEREIRDGKLYTRRLLSKTNPVPKWGERFYNAKSVKIVEDSILDPEKKILLTYTRNIGYKKVLRVDEKVEYRETEDGKTVAIRSAWISSQIFGFSRAIRAFGVERFKSNCNKTVSGFNYILNKMFPKHIAEVYQQNQQQQQQQVAATNVATDTVTATSSDSQSIQTSHSKLNKVKEAGKAAYDGVKTQARKIYQAYSVRN